jgi:hypothetical protein
MVRYLLGLILLSSSIISGIPEIHRIKEVINYIDPSKRTLVLFDIDNTLLCPATDLGADHWYDHIIRQKIAMGIDKKAAIKQLLPLMLHLNFHIDLLPIEATVADDVACIQKMCERTLCLTARSPVLIDKTLHHLHRHSLKFHGLELQEHTFNFAKPCIYKHGVLSCGWNCKGKVLITFLELINYTPEVIIFIDDKQHNLDAVKTALEGKGIEFIGLRYAGCDHKENMLNPEQTENALQTFLMTHPYTDEQYLPFF